MLDQIEDAWRMFDKICHLEMWSLGMPSRYWDMCNARKGRRRWNTYFDKLCNTKGVWSNFLTFVGLLNSCASVVVIESRVGVSMTRSLKVDGIQMSLWRVAWLTLSQMWECWECLEMCSTRYHFQMWSLGAFEMRVRAEGTIELIRKMQHKGVQSNYVTICGMLHTCLHSYAWRWQVSPWADHSNWMGFRCLCGESLDDMYAKCGTVWGCLKSVQQDAILDLVTQGACKM
jgi:hypothetical protein